MPGSEPEVSVVTPVYNTGKYLSECIESVLAQRYQNFEYLIVDNCSTDNSLEIARRYAARDARIRIHRNPEFLDLIPNWNHSLRQISPGSKYCKVVHADDCLFPECIAQMVALAESKPTIGIVGAYRLDENQVNLDGLPHTVSVFKGEEICRRYFLDNLFVFGSPTSLLIRADLLRKRQAFYSESNLHADLEACFELLREVDFGFVHQVLTYTRRHNESTTSFSRRYNTHRLGELMVLTRYGPHYLAETEYGAVLKKRLRRYYRELAKTLLVFRNKDTIDYHRKQMAAMNLRFSYFKLSASLLALLYNRFLRSARIV